jgi:type IV pilus assembly protein PilN
MRLDINLASQPYEDTRRFWLRWGTTMGFVAILTLALVFIAVTGWFNARRDRQQMSTLKQQIASRDNERTRAEVFLNQATNRSTRDKSQFLNELIQRKAFSWTKVFEELERVMPPRLHVVSIHPEMTNDNQLAIKMVVAGESRERALDLMRKMEGSQHFEQTHVTQVMEQSGGKPGDNVTFDISALYVPEKSQRGAP